MAPTPFTAAQQIKSLRAITQRQLADLGILLLKVERGVPISEERLTALLDRINRAAYAAGDCMADPSSPSLPTEPAPLPRAPVTV